MKNSKEIAKTVFQIRDEYLVLQRKRNRKIKIAASLGSAVCMFAIVMVCANRYSNSNLKLPYVTNSTTDTSTESNPDITSQQENENTEELTSTGTSLSENTVNHETTENADDNPNTNIAEESTLHDSNSNNEDKQTTMTPPPTNSIDTTSPTDDESYSEPKWDEKTISMQFPEFALNGITYGLRDADIPSEQIYSKIADVSLTGYDTYTETSHSIAADVFQISHISDNCAVAVKFLGYQDYYVYVNRNYYPQTLGELINSLDIENTISFGNMYLNDDTSVESYNKDLIRSFLLECGTAFRINDDSEHTTILSFSVNVGLLGIYNKSFTITEDGYLITNIMEWKYTFYIGADKANELAERLGINDIGRTTTANDLFSQEGDFYEE